MDMSNSMNSLCTGNESALGWGRRKFLNRFGMGFGGLALANMMNPAAGHAGNFLDGLHFPAKAKRVIFMFQSGGPSQIDMFDHKPMLNKMHGQELPDSVRRGQRLTGMSGNQSSLPLVGSPFKFAQYGQSGAWFSDLLPHTAELADDLCFIKSMHTEAINHGPGVTFVQTGSQIPGRPSLGAWLDYGLGTANQNLPGFVVMVTKGKGGQPLLSRLWGSGFLPAKHQGVRFRAAKDPVLYLNNPAGVDETSRRMTLDALRDMHHVQQEQVGDPELENRIAHYELAYRMQSSVPEVADLSSEPDHIFDLYGKDARTPGTFAANCLMARRLAEKDVKYIQLFHPGWDQHGGLVGGIRTQCRETDQASAALVKDLKQRGLLDDTLVVWGGEFGRTNYCQGKLAGDKFGRDHHPRCYTMWMAGAGVKGGHTHGLTDEFSYNVASDGVHVHDLNATILHLLGIDHERLSFRYQGRRFRLTDVHGHVIKDLFA
jgi:hypothetical protein